MSDPYTKFVLTIIAISLFVLSIRVGGVSEAQADAPSLCRIEGPVDVRITKMPDWKAGVWNARPIYTKEVR